MASDPVAHAILGLLDDGRSRPDQARQSAKAMGRVLRALARLSKTDEPLPSTREIGDEIDLGQTTVAHHLRHLAAIGLVERPSERQPRSTRLSEQGRALLAKEAR